jgi:hypothetical protein
MAASPRRFCRTNRNPVGSASRNRQGGDQWASSLEPAASAINEFSAERKLRLGSDSFDCFLVMSPKHAGGYNHSLLVHKPCQVPAALAGQSRILALLWPSVLAGITAADRG